MSIYWTRLNEKHHKFVFGSVVVIMTKIINFLYKTEVLCLFLIFMGTNVAQVSIWNVLFCKQEKEIGPWTIFFITNLETASNLIITICGKQQQQQQQQKVYKQFFCHHRWRPYRIPFHQVLTLTWLQERVFSLYLLAYLYVYVITLCLFMC